MTMRCRKAGKLMADFVGGHLAARKEARVRSHVAICEACADLWARERLVEEALPAWRDLPAPEDALGSIEARIAFAPPPAVLPRAGTIGTLVLPYVAALATAAAVLLAFRVGITDDPVRAPNDGAPAATEAVADAEPELLPGERTLEFVDRSGRLMQVPWDAETDRYLLRTLDPVEYKRLRSRATQVPVDYEVK